MAKKQIKVRLLSCRLEVNNDVGTLIDCEFRDEDHGPKAVIRHRRKLYIDGVISVLTATQKRAASKAARVAKRAAEASISRY